MSAKAGQRSVGAFDPRRQGTPQALEEKDRYEVRRVAVAREAELQAALDDVLTMPESPMRKALVEKYEGLLAGYRQVVAKF